MGLSKRTLISAALAACCVGFTTISGPAVAAPAAVTVGGFNGVNWAAPSDNYSAGNVVPSGLSTSDSYATTYAKATSILHGFQANLHANTVRLPINPPTVAGTWWSSYRAVVDAATAAHMNVILSYWDKTPSNDGVIDDLSAWSAMWRTITSEYQGNGSVYFEPMNEPYGYTASEWTNIVAQWISTYSAIPRGRIFVSGNGYNDHVTAEGADSRLTGTILSLHYYGYWNSYTTTSQWVSDFKARIGPYASRTVLDEFGAPMTTGLNYTGPINGNQYIAYLQAVTATVKSLQMGSVYWPGLRTGDSYGMEALHGTGTALSLTNNNASGVTELEQAYQG